jgi:ribosomal silencing factor RsfS
MQPAVRAYYNLEQLWGAAEKKKLSKAGKVAAKQ